MDILHLHFPADYSYTFDQKAKSFNFAPNIILKYSIVKTIIGWNTQPHFSSILYDEKFVALLLNFVVGKNNLIADVLPKEQMRFIRGTFFCFSELILQDFSYESILAEIIIF